MEKLFEDREDFYIVFKESEIDPNFEYFLNFEIYEDISWDEGGVPVETELYLSGTIKWDGCSHFNFGEDKDNYMHFCSYDDYKIFNRILLKCIEIASKKIKNFDKELADYTD